MPPDVVRTASAVGIGQRREVIATTDVEPMTSGGSAAGTIYAEGNTVAAFHLVAPTDDVLRAYLDTLRADVAGQLRGISKSSSPWSAPPLGAPPWRSRLALADKGEVELESASSAKVPGFKTSDWTSMNRAQKEKALGHKGFQRERATGVEPATSSLGSVNARFREVPES